MLNRHQAKALRDKIDKAVKSVTDPDEVETPAPPASWVDPDPAHNSDDPNDLDPAHHAPGWKPPATKPVILVPIPEDLLDVGLDGREEHVTDLNAKFGVNSWLGAWSGDVRETVRAEVAKNDDDVSVLIDYNQPDRDNGNYSAGGLTSLDLYDQWTKDIAAGIGDSPAWIIVGPDAIGLMDGLPADRQQLRWDCLQVAVDNYEAAPLTRVYVDLSMWIERDEAVRRIKTLRGLHGFSLNVSGFNTTAECLAFGDYVAQRTGLHYVIDTSRNGRGNPHAPAWCNVTDSLVGHPPTTTTASEYCDAYLWLKVPGESDGLKINGYDDDGQQDRNDIPRAGESWPEYRAAIYSGDWTSFKARYGVR